jgi:endonuclease/exonuclease/phosphatase (EEP) superfamily protein YafD
MIKNENGPIIMCGDLNVISRSPAMRELDFLRDLTAANNVRTTLKNIRLELDVACDHILISDEFSCNYFEVVETVLSDHKAIVVKLML